MNRIQHRRVAPVLATAALALTLGALPASARQDPGPTLPAHRTGTVTASYFCALQRVGTQYVACDNLTGNGVPAPAWVEQR